MYKLFIILLLLICNGSSALADLVVSHLIEIRFAGEAALYDDDDGDDVWDLTPGADLIGATGIADVTISFDRSAGAHQVNVSSALSGNPPSHYDSDKVSPTNAAVTATSGTAPLVIRGTVTLKKVHNGMLYEGSIQVDVTIAGGVNSLPGVGVLPNGQSLGHLYVHTEDIKLKNTYIFADVDGDGVMDMMDSCPDLFGDAANMGCPYDDRDNDGVFDHEDLCPDVAGTQLYMGCPATDSDGDGIIDLMDSCPSQAGPSSNSGCPVTDSDGDTVPDSIDSCPAIAGDPMYMGCDTSMMGM